MHKDFISGYTKRDMKIQEIAMLLLLTLAFAPVSASAETVLRVGDSVRIASDERVEEDFYAAGGSVAVSGEVVGDVYAAGGSVTANGAISEDLTAIGGTVDVHAPVEDDVRVIGGDVTIAESVKGDVFVLGGSLTILSSATIEGDVFFYGGEAVVAGDVAGSVVGGAQRFRIDAAVGENVDVSSSRPLVLGDRASVSGDVRYQSFGELSRAQNAVVEGDIVHNEPATEEGSGAGAAVMAFIIHLFAALCVYLFAKRELSALMQNTIANYGRSSVVGLSIFFLMPVVIVLLMVTLIGGFLGVMGLFAFLTLLALALALVPIFLGALISKFAVKTTHVDLVWIIVGALVAHAALQIPFIGPLAVFATFLLVLGGLVWRCYRSIR